MIRKQIFVFVYFFQEAGNKNKIKHSFISYSRKKKQGKRNIEQETENKKRKCY